MRDNERDALVAKLNRVATSMMRDDEAAVWWIKDVREVAEALAAPAEGDGAVDDAWQLVHVLTSVMRMRPLTEAEQDELHSAHVTIRNTRPAATAVVPEGFVLVPRAAALVAANVANEWAVMFADIPGLEKYDRFQYGPAVEQMHDDMLAAADARAALTAALAQQPAAVDGVAAEEAIEQRAIAAYEKHMGVSADDPAYGPDLYQWMAGWNAALAAHSGSKSHDC